MLKVLNKEENMDECTRIDAHTEEQSTTTPQGNIFDLVLDEVTNRERPSRKEIPFVRNAAGRKMTLDGNILTYHKVRDHDDFKAYVAGDDDDESRYDSTQKDIELDRGSYLASRVYSALAFRPMNFDGAGYIEFSVFIQSRNNKKPRCVLYMYAESATWSERFVSDMHSLLADHIIEWHQCDQHTVEEIPTELSGPGCNDTFCRAANAGQIMVICSERSFRSNFKSGEE